MSQIWLIWSIDGLSLLGVGLFAVLTLRKRDKGRADFAFLLLLFSIGLWVSGSATIWTLAHFGLPTLLANQVTAVVALLLSLSLYAFSDSFLPFASLPLARTRHIILIFMAIPMLPLFFFDEWMKVSQTPVDGTYHRIVGWPYLVTSGAGLMIAILAMLNFVIKYFRVEKGNHRTQLLYLIVSICLGITLAAFFTLYLPARGFGSFSFLGPGSVLVFVSLSAFAVLNWELLQLRTAAIRLVMSFLSSVFFAALTYALLAFLFLKEDARRYMLPYLILQSIFFVFFYVFIKRIQPIIDRKLIHSLPDPREVIIAVSRTVFDNIDRTPEIFFQQVMELLNKVLHFKKGFMLVIDPVLKAVQTNIGPAPSFLHDRKVNMFLRIRRAPGIADDIIDLIDRIIPLEPKSVSSSVLSIKAKARRYKRLSSTFSRLLELLAENDYELFVPLFYKSELFGFICLSEKVDDFPYSRDEIRLLDGIRMTISLGIRTQLHHEHMRYLQENTRSEAERLAEFISEKASVQVGERTLVYASKQMADVVKWAQEVALMRDHAVLITGCTGTGKELIARHIHECGPSRKEPFVALNVVSIPPQLLEDELFGHTKGAFTDAKGKRTGKIALAAHGTLFLDEIGEMPMELQPKLLRLLQERTFFPLGSDHEHPARCRFMFATNHPLPDLVRSGRFREDLFYRIHVLPVHIPVLKDRTEDIGPLVEYFLHLYASDRPGYTRQTLGMEERALRALMRYAWPGNVRELENVIIRTMAATRSQMITFGDLPMEIRMAIGSRSAHIRTNSEHKAKEATPDRTIALENLVSDYRKKLIEEALENSGGNKTKAAEMLGITRQRLFYQMRLLGLD